MALEKNIKTVNLARKSYYDYAEHMQDDIKNYGYDYEDQLFERSVSNYILQDKTRGEIINRFSILYAYMIDKVKDIKRSYNYAVGKKYKKFN